MFDPAYKCLSKAERYDHHEYEYVGIYLEDATSSKHTSRVLVLFFTCYERIFVYCMLYVFSKILFHFTVSRQCFFNSKLSTFLQ
jgi:hypothetical protein